jgi:hypothetical protein
VGTLGGFEKLWDKSLTAESTEAAQSSQETVHAQPYFLKKRDGRCCWETGVR